MKPATRTNLGLLLIAVAIVYLIWLTPWGLAWLVGLLGGLLLLVLATRSHERSAFGYGAVLVGWSLGALAADAMGFESLKVIGAGLGLLLWGAIEDLSPAYWGGLALLAAGALVFLWESSLGGVVVLLLLLGGLYLVLRSPDLQAEPAGKTAKVDETTFKALVRWRNQKARAASRRNTELLSDQELGCLAGLADVHDLQRVRSCLQNKDLELAKEIAAYLQDTV